MKKVLATVAVSTALIMGGAAAASAAGIEMEGSVRVRGLSEQKYTQNSAPYTYYDERVRIGMKSKPSDNLTGYILLETGSDKSDTYKWGSETGTTLVNGGTQLGGNGTMGVLQAWIDYKTTANTGIKIGHMPIAPGTKQFINHDNSGDDAIVAYWNPSKNTHAHVATIKLAENVDHDNSDDLDAYAAVVTHKFSDAFKMGANYVFLKGSAEQAETATGPTLFPGLALSNLGIDATYKAGKLTLTADVNKQFGSVADDGTTSTDANGYAFRIGADYKIDNSNVGLLFAQGSGQDLDETGNDYNAFVNFLGDSAYNGVYVPGYRKTTPGSFGAVSGLNGNSGLSNLTIYQVNAKTATTCPLTGKKLKIKGSLSYMTTTEDVNNYGTNREDEVGTELDIIAAWALTSNLTYQVEAAYLWTGDVYKTSATYDPENAYFLRHGITMKF